MRSNSYTAPGGSFVSVSQQHALGIQSQSMAAEANDDEYGIKPSCSISRDTGITLDGGAGGRPLGWGLFDPNMLGPFAFFGQPPKCDVAHTSLPIPLSNIRLIDLSPGGKNGTGARDHSCDGGDRRSDHDVGGPFER